MNWLERQAQAHPQAVALIEGDRRLSYLDLANAAERLAARLQGLGIAPGDRVGLSLPTGLDAAISIHALFWVGAVVVLIHPRVTASEATEQAENAECRAVISTVDLGSATMPTWVPDTLDREASDNRSSPAFDRPHGSLAVIAFTSGTTGQPKQVLLSTGNLFASAAASAFNLEVQSDDRWLCCLPLAHVGGLMVLVRSVLYGTSVHLLAEFDPTEVAGALASDSITHGSLVPTQLRRLLDHVEPDWRPDPRLRALLIGGGPAVGDELARGIRHALPILGTYGMTEAASQLTTAPLPAPGETARQSKLGSAGLPLAGVSLEIRRDSRTGDDLPSAPVEGASGEIWARGPMISATSLDEAGWLDTGDFGRLDDDGYLWVAARRVDRIVSGGENIDPVEVERIVMTAPEVTDCAVVGVADEEWGQKVVALIVPKNKTDSPDEFRKALVEHCRKPLAKFKTPKAWVFVDGLPRTITGKLRRGELIRTLEQHHASKTQSESNRSIEPDS